MEYPPYEKMEPPAQLAMAAKIATQIANGEEVEYGGKVLNPLDYAEVARELASGDREWADLISLNEESINGIGKEYEKIHPSTKLTGYKIKKPPKRVGVLKRDRGEVDLTGFESGAEGLSARGMYGKVKGAFEGLRQ
jgi:hypothetical protein